jgi:hypothetical protein
MGLRMIKTWSAAMVLGGCLTLLAGRSAIADEPPANPAPGRSLPPANFGLPGSSYAPADLPPGSPSPSYEPPHGNWPMSQPGGCASNSTTPVGRYAIAVTADSLYLVDTATGECWIKNSHTDKWVRHVQPVAASAPATDGQPSANEQTAGDLRGRPFGLRVSGPRSAPVGSEVEFQIEFVNRTDALMTNVEITDRFDAGLEHAISPSPIQRELPNLPPDSAQQVAVKFRVTRAGVLRQTVMVSSGDRFRSASASVALILTAVDEAWTPATPPSDVRPSSGPGTKENSSGVYQAPTPDELRPTGGSAWRRIN